MLADLQALARRLEAKAAKRRAAVVLAFVLTFVAVVGFVCVRIPRVRSWLLGQASAERAHEFKSLAVLPLENLTGDAGQDYFVDGMTDALITNLTQLGSLRVISRTSAMHYKGTHKALREIVRELNIGAVVVGSVARSGNRVRISVQLADASGGQNL
jgi:TolB-like protein